MNRKQKQIMICLVVVFILLSAMGLWADSGVQEVEPDDQHVSSVCVYLNVE